MFKDCRSFLYELGKSFSRHFEMFIIIIIISQEIVFIYRSCFLTKKKKKKKTKKTLICGLLHLPREC